MTEFDLGERSVRELNAALHALDGESPGAPFEVRNPRGAHAVAVGIDAPAIVNVHGHVGYYCAGMNQHATVVVNGNAAARCGISLKGADIVVKGNVGHMSAFMAQAGNLVVLGDAGDALGDSLYEAKLYVRGAVASLGADCIEKKMKDKHRKQLRALLDAAGLGGEVDVADFTRYGSARRLYHFHIDNVDEY